MTAHTMRIDKWLWQARFFKSRTQASKLCAAGRVRVDGAIINKAHFAIKPGDVLTFPQARDIRVVRVEALGTRRGPAVEARTLYEDLAPTGPGAGGARRPGRGAAKGSSTGS